MLLQDFQTVNCLQQAAVRLFGNSTRGAYDKAEMRGSHSTSLRAGFSTAQRTSFVASVEMTRWCAELIFRFAAGGEVGELGGGRSAEGGDGEVY